MPLPRQCCRVEHPRKVLGQGGGVLDDAIVTPDWTFDHLHLPDVLDLLQDGALFSFGVRGVNRTFRLTDTDVGWTLLRNDEDSGSAAGSPSSAQAR